MISTQDPSARDRAGLYDINATDDAGATALIYAARAGYVGVIKQLLAHGASATKEGYGGLAPLHHALIHLREPACHALLESCVLRHACRKDVRLMCAQCLQK